MMLREFLFEPLGITDHAWTKNLKSGILEEGGLRLRSRDLAKIGQLVVNGGNWNGRQIVSQKWVKESTAAHIGPAHLTYFYEYQWWLGRSLVEGLEVQWVCAMGHGGQRIFAVPALDLWPWLPLDSPLTHLMGGCRWSFSIATCWEQ